MAEKRRISVTTDGFESQNCDGRQNLPVSKEVSKPVVSPISGGVVYTPAPGEVRNPEGHNQYNTLTKKGMQELLDGNKVDLTIKFEDKSGKMQTRRLHFEMQDGQPLHKGVAAILLGKALSGDLKAATELSKIVNGVTRDDGSADQLPTEIKVTVVNSIRNG